MTTVEVILGDCRELLPGIATASIDAIVTDPPAGVSFMSKTWDSDRGGREQWVAWLASIMLEARRCLRPGGYALVWALPRTSHWTATALEDAGFEIRDVITHHYSQGFPKSLNVSKAIDKMAPRRALFGPFAMHLRERRQAAGLTSKQVAEHFKTAPERINHGGCVSNWEQGYGVPTVEQWRILQPLLALSDEWLPLIEREEAERSVIGTKRMDALSWYAQTERRERDVDITIPATDAAKQWEGWGTALKPASEHWILARAPLSEPTIAANVLAHGTGALNIDATRVGPRDRTEYGLATAKRSRGSTYGAPSESADFDSTAGRWPSNLLLSHSAACAEDCAPSCPVRTLDEQSGTLQSGYMAAGTHRANQMGYNGAMPETTLRDTYADAGGASRYFPTFRYEPKPDRAERDAMWGDVPQRFRATMGDGIGAREHNPDEPTAWARNHHPTVKSIELMRWLCRLITPAGGTVLDPFCGSGSTGCAAVLEGFRFIGIEQDESYVRIAQARIAHVQGPLFLGATLDACDTAGRGIPDSPAHSPLPLFGNLERDGDDEPE